MPRIRRYLPPPMACEQAVDESSSHLAPYALRQRRPNRRQHQHSTLNRFFRPWPQEVPFFFFGQQQVSPPAPLLAAFAAGIVPSPEPGLETRHGCSSNT